MILPKYSHDQHIYKQAMVVLHYRSGEFHHRSVYFITASDSDHMKDITGHRLIPQRIPSGTKQKPAFINTFSF